MTRLATIFRSTCVLVLVGLGVTLFSTRGYSQELTVGSYNIRYANEGDSLKGNGWDQRGPVIAQLIQFYDFDILGTQEVLYRQIVDLGKLLPNYKYIGIGRDDGKRAGEFSPIFYKEDKFKLLDKGDFWLSTETDHPNKGWDAALPRICSWGHFEDIESGETFYFFNTHFDHVGIEARKESAKLILDKIRSIAGNHHTILTGDFNVNQDNESYKLINSSNVLHDAYDNASFKYELNGTFNSFDPNSRTESRIDHIFLTDDFKVDRYGILTDTYRSVVESTESSSGISNTRSSEKYQARLPSDHFPVMIKLQLIPADANK